MARSGQGAGKPPAAVTARGSGRSAVQPEVSGRRSNLVLALVALGMVRHMLRSRRLYEVLAVAAIALGSLRGISQDSRAGATARLAAWNKREIERLEHKAERQARAIKGAAEMMAHSELPSVRAGAGCLTFLLISPPTSG